MKINKNAFLTVGLSTLLVCLSMNAAQAQNYEYEAKQGIAQSIGTNKDAHNATVEGMKDGSNGVFLPQNIQGKDIANAGTSLFSSIGSALKNGVQKITNTNQENNNVSNSNNAPAQIIETRQVSNNNVNENHANNVQEPAKKEESSLFSNIGASLKSGWQKTTQVTGTALQKAGAGIQNMAQTTDSNQAGNVAPVVERNIDSSTINITENKALEIKDEQPVSNTTSNAKNSKLKNKLESKSQVTNIRDKAIGDKATNKNENAPTNVLY